MKDIILVNICKDHTWECSDNIIGRTGEGDISVFKILLTEEKMSNYSVYLEFKKSNGERFRSKKLSVENNIAFYQIPKYLLAENGRLQVQLILEKDDSKLWASTVKTYYVLESISGMEQIPEIDSDEYIPSIEDIFNDGSSNGESTAVTSLINTTWTFQNGLEAFNEVHNYNLKFVTGNLETFYRIMFYPDMGLIFDDKVVYGITDGVGTWIDKKYQTVSFVDGNDVTDTNAISFMKNFATNNGNDYVKEEDIDNLFREEVVYE